MNYLVYDSISGLVLRAGICSDAAHVQLHAQTGETVDAAPPADVTADGLWQWTPSGYVHNAPPAPTIAELSAYASGKASAIQSVARSYTGGTTSLASDASAASLADWLALQQWASLNPNATTNWVANDGTVTPLPAVAITPIATAVGIYSQSVWQTLAGILTSIAGGTITTMAQIDSAPWPT